MSERECGICKEVKPANGFRSRMGDLGIPLTLTTCKACEVRQAQARRARYAAEEAQEAVEREQISAYLRDWARNVEPGQPAWRVA